LHNLLGKAYELDGAHDKAVVELQEALKRNPYEESYYFDLADVLLRHQNFDAAIRVLESSREVFAKSPQLELALGVAYYGQRRFSDAVDSFLRTIAMAPDVEQPYVFLGRILEHAGDRIPQITDAFAAFAGRNPRSAIAQHLHAKALIASGDSARAESLLRRAIELQPSLWEAHYELGLLFEKSGKLADAAAAIERSIALSPKAPAPHDRLARIYDRLGQREAAAEQRALHQKLTEEEKAAMEKHAAGVKRLELVIK
jgi:tetratricopeptide (TPR) repeat protein